jgi:hypothetical protein
VRIAHPARLHRHRSGGQHGFASRSPHQTIGENRAAVPRVRRLRRKRFRSRTRRRISGPRLQRPNRAVCVSRLNADLSSGAEPLPRGANSSKRPLSANVGFRWLLVRDLNPQIRAERNLARSAWRFITITKGGLKQFQQCVVMERPLMAAINGKGPGLRSGFGWLWWPAFRQVLPQLSAASSGSTRAAQFRFAVALPMGPTSNRALAQKTLLWQANPLTNGMSCNPPHMSRL